MESPPPPPPPYLSTLENCIISSSQEVLLDEKGFAFSDDSDNNVHQDGNCGVEGGEKRIRFLGECSSGSDKKDECGEKAKESEEEEEEDIISIVIRAGLEMPWPRWWRSGGYET
ncbi:hypothetical protein MKW92_046801 [Papaver armeniacum]|nr:hypothetical protein MKW92_046801 [Papaver armeniacum]